jgi:hypothetical protein
MNTLAHIAGLISTLWLAYVSFSVFAAEPPAEGARQVPGAEYLGWAFVILALYFIPRLIIAMRYDFIDPIGEDS